MCARYCLHETNALIQALFDLEFFPSEWEARYNIAPTNLAPIVGRFGGLRKAIVARWGLVPSFSAEIGGRPLINARAETAFEKPSFRTSIRSRRCLVPANGFFEWKEIGKQEQPHYIQLAGGKPMALAGVFDQWNGPDGPVISYAVITRAANPFMSAIHDRMPVILSSEWWDPWLDAGIRDEERLRVAIESAEDVELMSRLVDPKMGSTKVQGPEVLKAPIQATLEF